MAHKIDLREAPRDESGLIIPVGDSSNVTSQDENGNVTFHTLPQFQRDIKQQILLLLMISDRAMSRSQIAKGLGLKKTPWLHDRIEWLVEHGHITKNVISWKNGVPMYFYGLPKHSS